MDSRVNFSIATDIFEAAARADKPRKYLGMSEAGHPCDRYLWFRFRRFTPAPIEPRIYLLFRFGDKVEELVCHHLRAAGYQLEHAWPDPQLAFSTLGGLLRGHSDGIIHLPDGKAILEIKSANRKKFQAFALGGVRKVYEKYYWQAQLYMGSAGLSRTLFVIVCKDDSNIHTEIVPFSQADFDSAIARISRLVTGCVWPKVQDIPDCQYCDFRIHCKTTEGVQVEHSCMTCNMLQVKLNGQAEFLCQHPSHPYQIHHPDMTCDDYSWLGETPF